MTKLIDLTGKTFSRWLVLRRDMKHPIGESWWVCKCKCGAISSIPSTRLRKGNSKSCGCYRKEFAKQQHTTHGMWGTPERSTWGAMISRCFNKDNTNYPNYGGRGVTVCKRWLRFENFFIDMGRRPYGHSLGRKDNNKGYCKKNCQWETGTQQARNTRATRLNLEKAIALIRCIENGTPYLTACKQFGIKSTGHAYLIVKGKMWPEARKIVNEQKYA